MLQSFLNQIIEIRGNEYVCKHTYFKLLVTINVKLNIRKLHQIEKYQQ